MKPNPCRVCGVTPYDPLPDGDGGFSIFCYRDAHDHTLMIHGWTPEETVERWNRLNPAHGAPDPRLTPIQGILSYFRRTP